jgi:hypothetical protein
MPQLLVVTDLPEDGGKVVYRERIVSSDFESRHFTGQLAERLGWAVRDAHELTGRAEDDAERPATLTDEEPTALDEPAPPGLTVLAS